MLLRDTSSATEVCLPSSGNPEKRNIMLLCINQITQSYSGHLIRSWDGKYTKQLSVEHARDMISVILHF